MVKQESFDGNGNGVLEDNNGSNDDDYAWSPDEQSWELERPPRKRRRRQARQFTFTISSC